MRIPDASDACWIDGQRTRVEDARVSITDPALQSGLGLFETLALREGRVLDLHAHCRRLFEGLERLEIDPPSREALEATVREAATEDSPATGWLKIIVTGGGRNIVFRGPMDPSEEGRAVSAVLVPWRRNPRDPLAGLKTLSYAANTLGLRHARKRGADEGIWLTTSGALCEGCTSNLFVVRHRTLFTPAVREGILPGVTRGRVLDAARRLGLQVHEGKLRLPRLRRANEAFLTSSLRGVRPLVRFEGRPVGNGERGPVTRRLAQELERARNEENPAVGAPPPGSGESGLTRSIGVTKL